MDSKEIIRRMRAVEFRKNNRIVLQTINILRHGYMRLASAADVLAGDIDAMDFWDCINFLQEAGYILVRDIGTRSPVELADAKDREALESRLSEKGIRLMNGVISDEMIER